MILRTILTLLLLQTLLGQVIKAQEVDGYDARSIADSLEKRGDYKGATEYYSRSNEAFLSEKNLNTVAILKNYVKLIKYHHWNVYARETLVDFIDFASALPHEDSLNAYIQYAQAAMPGDGFNYPEEASLHSALSYFRKVDNKVQCALINNQIAMLAVNRPKKRGIIHLDSSSYYLLQLPKSKFRDEMLINNWLEQIYYLSETESYERAFILLDKTERYFKDRMEKAGLSVSGFYRRFFHDCWNLHQQIGNYDLAMKYLNISIQLGRSTGHNIATALQGKVENLRLPNRPKRSINLVNKNLQLNLRKSKQTWLQLEKGWSFYELNQLDSAIVAFNKAYRYSLSANRKSAGYSALIGLVFASKKDVLSAQEYLNLIKTEYTGPMDRLFRLAEIQLLIYQGNYDSLGLKLEEYFKFSHSGLLIKDLVDSTFSFSGHAKNQINPFLFHENTALKALDEYLRVKSIVPGDHYFKQRLNLNNNIVQIMRTKKNYSLYQEDLLWQSDKIQGYYSNLIDAHRHLASYRDPRSNMEETFRIAELSKNHLVHINLGRKDLVERGLIPDSIARLERQLALKESRLRSLIPQSVGRDSVRLEIQLIYAQKSRDSLFRVITNQYPEYYNTKYKEHEIFTTQQVRENLKTGEAFLEYFVGKASSYAFVITKKDFQMVSIQLHKDTLIQRFRNQIQHQQDSYELQELSNKIYASYVEPAIVKLSDTIKTLIVSPAGGLHYLPLEVLSTSPKTDSETHSFLIQRYDIRYCHSASLYFLEQETPLAKPNYVAFAPDYKTSISDKHRIQSFGKFRNQITNLEYNDDEVSNMGNYLRGKSYIGDKATEKSFKEALENSGIIHLAMHAIVDDEKPMNSRLIFADEPDSLEDGSLHAFELYDMKIPAHLAVLSACETGYGKLANGEGALSLARAFSYAGCPSIVMSHWPVDDQSTSEIMTTFYKYLSKGWDKGKALRQAKLDFLEHGDPTRLHPFYWGSFVLQGDPRPITSSPDRRWVIAGIGLVSLLIILLFFHSRNRNFTTS